MFEILLGIESDNRSLLTQYENQMSSLEYASRVFVFISTTLTQSHALEAWCFNPHDTLTHSQSQGFRRKCDVTSGFKRRKIHGHDPALLSPIQAKLILRSLVITLNTALVEKTVRISLVKCIL